MIKKPSVLRRSSIFNQIFSILAIMIAVSAVFNLTTMIWMRNHFLTLKLQEQDDYIDAYASTMNDALTNVQNILTVLQRSRVLQNRCQPGYARTDGYLLNEQAIFEQLNTFSATSSAVSDIFIFWGPEEYLQTKTGIIWPETYYRNRFQGDYQQWLKILGGYYSTPTVRYAPGTLTGENPSSNIYILQSIFSNGRKMGVICLLIDSSFVSSIFNNRSLAAGREIFVLIEGEQILAKGGSPEPELLLQTIRSKEIRNSSLYLGRQGVFSHRDAILSGIEYMIYTPYEQVSGDFDRIFLLTNGLFLLLMTLLFVYAYRMSRQFSQPFQSVLKALSGGGEKISDETGFIASRVLDILSDNSDMEKTMASSSRIILQAMFYRLIMGAPPAQEFLDVSASYNLPLSKGRYGVIVLRMDLPYDQEELFYTNYAVNFHRTLDSYLGGWILETIQTRPDEYTAIFCLESKDALEEVLAALKDACTEWSQEIPGAVFCGSCSDCVEDLSRLRSCYQQSLSVLRSRPVQSEGVVFTASEKNAVPTLPFLPDDLEQQLREMLEKSTYDYLFDYVQGILNHNYRDNVSYETYLSVCDIINRYVFRYVQRQDSAACGDMIAIDFADCNYPPLRCSEVVLSNLAIACSLSSTRTPGGKTVIEQAVLYLDEHFAEDINLSSVAQQLGYTPNHLSRYFKQSKGINFTDYLNRKRVEYAKTLLITTKQPLQQIAEAAGFRSANLLIRAFEKYEGLTPGAFRKRFLSTQPGLRKNMK